MSNSSNSPAAGWYANPLDSSGETMRYWSGSVWTSEVRPKLLPPSGEPEIDLKDQPTIDSGVPSIPEQVGKKGLFGGKKELESENEQLRNLLSSIGIEKRDLLKNEIEQLNSRKGFLETEVKNLQLQLIGAQDQQTLQEVGIYNYQHPLDTSIEYKETLDKLKEDIKKFVKNGAAVTAITAWTVNGSQAEGKKMVNEVSKLMLRAYVAEADNCIRTLKPSSRESMIERLTKTKTVIAKLGRSMQIQISDQFHELKIKEIRATADFLKKKEEEKEEERENRARLREEEKVAKEIANQREKMEKERAKLLGALAKLEGKDSDSENVESIEELKKTLAEIESGLSGLTEREANVRSGHVYVISNWGAFGKDVIKIGMTRRLEPEDRVKELSDASVPFKYEIHALFYSKDAQGLEASLHKKFDARRVNLVNNRKEFFLVSPAEVRNALIELDGHVLEFNETPENEEFRLSEVERLKLLPPAVN